MKKIMLALTLPFSPLSSPLKVMRYFQLESRISATVNYQMTQGIPLAK